jgi:hypothetical protein
MGTSYTGVMKRIVLLLVIAGLFLGHATTANAGGWGGSRYDKSDCTYSKDTRTLFCEAWFTEEIFTTEQFAIADDSCASTTRLIERTGWRITTYRGWGLFDGPVPAAANEIAGNEDGFTVTWRGYADRDLGCL